MSGWQPIATAPKDGTYVLVYGTGIVGIAQWFSPTQKWEEVGVHAIMTPTHWQPLPDPPVAEGEGQNR